MARQAEIDANVRVVIGAVTHADGSVTCGTHVRNAQGLFVLFDPGEGGLDLDRWVWATAQATRVLQGLPIEPYVAPGLVA